MGRFYLHLRDLQGAVVEDVDGSEFQSVADAKEHAMLAMHELVGDAIKRSEKLELEAIILADDQGTVLAAVPVVAALPPTIVGLMKYPNKLVPPDRFEEYRRYADECRAKADSTADHEDQRSWLKLANAWLLMLPEVHSSGDLAGWPKSSEEDSKASH